MNSLKAAWYSASLALTLARRPESGPGRVRFRPIRPGRPDTTGGVVNFGRQQPTDGQRQRDRCRDSQQAPMRRSPDVAGLAVSLADPGGYFGPGIPLRA
jgi:hypothetical protein